MCRLLWKWSFCSERYGEPFGEGKIGSNNRENKKAKHDVKYAGGKNI